MEPNAPTRRLFPIEAIFSGVEEEGVRLDMAQDDKRPTGRDTIDANLKRVYQQTLEQEVPDRFKDLLAQLKAQDSERKTGGDTSK